VHACAPSRSKQRDKRDQQGTTLTQSHRSGREIASVKHVPRSSSRVHTWPRFTSSPRARRRSPIRRGCFSRVMLPLSRHTWRDADEANSLANDNLAVLPSRPTGQRSVTRTRERTLFRFSSTTKRRTAGSRFSFPPFSQTGSLLVRSEPRRSACTRRRQRHVTTRPPWSAEATDARRTEQDATP
jgi:hypothetical protein